MRKSIYESAELTVISFDMPDIITQSSPYDEGDQGDWTNPRE